MESISETMGGYSKFLEMGNKIKGRSNREIELPKSYHKPVYEKPVIYTSTSTTPVRIIDNRTCINSTTSKIELPEVIASLVDNKDYLPKHNKLAREYGVKYILKLAELAETKKSPSHWYAKVTSKSNWENVTLPMLEKLFKAIESATKAMQKLGIGDKWIRYYTKVAYRTSEAVFNSILEQAQTSAKTTPQHYFKYLSTQVQ